MIQFLSSWMRSHLSAVSKTAAPLLLEVVEEKLSEHKGALLFAAPPELPPDLQKVLNSHFQQSFDSLSEELIKSLALPYKATDTN